MAYVPPTTLVREKQIKAWSYYGAEIGTGTSTLRTATNDANRSEAVGEVRYIIGWAADQMSRIGWRVLVDGSPEWELTLSNGKTVKSDPEDGKDSHAKASNTVLSSIGWDDSTVRLVSSNLYVAGELYYASVGNDWQVISVVHPKARQIFEQAKYVVRGVWPSPVDPEEPDAPLFGVLGILEDMDWLSRLSRSQSANRVGMRGILGSADGLEFAGGGDFWAEWDKSLRAKMTDPTDVGPVHLRGAKELVEPMASGRGMGGLSWVVPDFPYDSRIDGRMEALIRRLSYGLPIPPEILLGLQAQSRATAFQVEENSYRAHIEPPAKLVAQVATDVLNTLFDVEIKVVPDPSDLLSKLHTVQDVKDAHERGAVSDAYLREALAIPDHAAPSPEEKAERLAAQAGAGAHSATTETPRSRAARHDKEDPNSRPDEKTLSEWRGRIEIATYRARDRVGAKARTHQALREVLPNHLENAEVPARLGRTALESSGLDVAGIVSDSLLFLGPRSAAGDNFVDALTEHVLDDLDSEVPVAMDDDTLARLLQGLVTP